jgi:hypothetical protein
MHDNSRPDLEIVTNMQAELTPVKEIKTVTAHGDTRGEGEERRKTVKILDITTLDKGGNGEGNLVGNAKKEEEESNKDTKRERGI